jgi:ectoine hydroxylase-related dioxygenase (phytanoyl-CoA dioxygenase family)
MNNAHGVCEELIDRAAVVPVAAAAGDAIVFEARTIHGTAANTGSPLVRWTVIVRYNDIGGAPYLKDRGAPMRIEQV